MAQWQEFERYRGWQPFTFADQMARKMPLHRYIKSGAAQTWR
ncbi:putative Insecticidal toxin protein [Pseudomonas syringae pv. apii]|uniref:Putative Insecticidal toxin protein n=1 Tax=Pseudomonas syringae pv. apii TaxID=81036 RepID=A0A3M5XA23_9PSED|nr:putative Insecticidal toxin protein [Pseudomonas syringae pv. apii]